MNRLFPIRSVKRIFNVIILILYVQSLNSQPQKMMDSLVLCLKNATSDTVKMKLRMDIGEEGNILRSTYWDSVASDCKNFLSKLNQRDRSFRFYTMCLADALNNAGYSFKSHGNSLEALSYYEKSLQLQEKYGVKSAIANSLNNLAVVYKEQGDIAKALNYLHRSLIVLEKAGHKEETAQPLNNIAGIYCEQGDTAKGLEYYLKSLQILQQGANKKRLAGSLNNIGYVYFRKKDYTNAMKYYLWSLKVFEEAGVTAQTGGPLGNIGLLYQQQGDFEKALDYFEQSLKIREKSGDKEGITISMGNIAGIWYKKKNYNKALEIATKSMGICNELGYPENIYRTAELLSSIYKAKGDFAKSLEYKELFVRMRDVVSSEQTKKATVKNQLKYEYEKKSAADSVKNAEAQKVTDALLQAQNAQIAQEKFQRYSLITGLVLVLGGLVFVINRFRLTQKQKKIIEAQKLKVDEAYEELHEKNKEVLDSITYARRIQRALITSESYIERNLRNLNK